MHHTTHFHRAGSRSWVIPLFAGNLIAASPGLTGTPAPPASQRAGVAVDPQRLSGRVEHIGAMKVLTVWGTPHDRGLAHGYLLGADIHQTVAQYLDDAALSGGPEVYEKIAARYVAVPLMPDDPRIDEELRGMLVGIRARLGQRGMMLDAVHRPLDLRDLRAIQFASDAAPRGCSSFAAWGKLTSDGRVLAGRNLDWYASKCLVGHGVVIVYAADPAAQRLGWASLTWPGAIGCYTGMNEQGVTLAIHDVAGRTPPLSPGIAPRPLVLREAIEKARGATATDDIASVFRTHRVLVGTNAAITAPSSAAKVPAAVCEFDGFHKQQSGVTIRRPDKGRDWQACTNHYRRRAGSDRSSPVADDKPGCCGRYDTLLAELLAAPSGKPIDMAAAWKMLAAVAMDGRTSQEVLTQQSVVFEPDARRMHVAFGRPGVPAARCEPTTLDVHDLLKRARP